MEWLKAIHALLEAYVSAIYNLYVRISASSQA